MFRGFPNEIGPPSLVLAISGAFYVKLASVISAGGSYSPVVIASSGRAAFGDPGQELAGIPASSERRHGWAALHFRANRIALHGDVRFATPRHGRDSASSARGSDAIAYRAGSLAEWRVVQSQGGTASKFKRVTWRAAIGRRAFSPAPHFTRLPRARWIARGRRGIRNPAWALSRITRVSTVLTRFSTSYPVAAAATGHGRVRAHPRSHRNGNSVAGLEASTKMPRANVPRELPGERGSPRTWRLAHSRVRSRGHRGRRVSYRVWSWSRIRVPSRDVRSPIGVAAGGRGRAARCSRRWNSNRSPLLAEILRGPSQPPCLHPRVRALERHDGRAPLRFAERERSQVRVAPVRPRRGENPDGSPAARKQRESNVVEGREETSERAARPVPTPLRLSLSVLFSPSPFLPPLTPERTRHGRATRGSRRPCLARITSRREEITRDHRTTRPPQSAEGLSSDCVRPRPAIGVSSAGAGARAWLRATERGGRSGAAGTSARAREWDRRPCAGKVGDSCVRRRRTRERRHGVEGVREREGCFAGS